MYSCCIINAGIIVPLSPGFLKEGCELINEALNLFNNVYGAMHVEICACLRLLARLNYIMGDHPEVRHAAQKIALQLNGFVVIFRKVLTGCLSSLALSAFSYRHLTINKRLS